MVDEAYGYYHKPSTDHPTLKASARLEAEVIGEAYLDTIMPMHDRTRTNLSK